MHLNGDYNHYFSRWRKFVGKIKYGVAADLRAPPEIFDAIASRIQHPSRGRGADAVCVLYREESAQYGDYSYIYSFSPIFFCFLLLFWIINSPSRTEEPIE